MKFEELKSIMKNFITDGEIISARAFGDGHINDTFLVSCNKADGKVTKYTLQHINSNVFPRPDEVMENIVNVTSFLKNKIAKNGGNPERETLSVVFAKDGKSYFLDDNGLYWRVYPYIDDALTYNMVNKPEDFCKCGSAVGNFMLLLADYPASSLHETIKNFHNTPSRYNDLMKAIDEDKAGRAASVAAEIEFVKQRKEFTEILVKANEKGEIPLRVTHNDTKLNNVLFDRASDEPICLIDLDTIMPGFSASDFGDAIRVGANTGAEDEKELSLVGIDLGLYEQFTKGYLESCKNALTKRELELLPYGAKMLTLECGMRFLTDYLNGDVYFKTHYSEHNLVRCRSQFKLVASMEENWDKMVEINNKYSK